MSTKFLSLPNVEELNSTLNSNSSDTNNNIIERSEIEYIPTFQRFNSNQEKTFTQQYSHIYQKRLQQLKDITKAAAIKKWNLTNDQITDRIIGVKENDEVILIGTLFKEMRLKPNILDDYAAEIGLQRNTNSLENYTSNDDFLIMEDESGRITLIGDIPIHQLSTGLIIAVKGIINELGELIVNDWCPPGIPPPSSSFNNNNNTYPDINIVLVSGLNIGSNDNPLTKQLLIDYISGRLLEDETNIKKIGGIIIAGNSVVPLDLDVLKDRNLSVEDRNKLAIPLNELDLSMAEIAPALPIILMPGEKDPSNYTLPQLPLNGCLFPNSTRFSTFHSVPNPFESKLNNRLILGTSGQNIDDIRRYSLYQNNNNNEIIKNDENDNNNMNIDNNNNDNNNKMNIEKNNNINDTIEILKDTLTWRHISPTSPDTLPIYPFIIEDPFVIEECPDIYFAGNQDKFATDIIEGQKGQKIRLISIPNFSKTKEAVILNLQSLDCWTISFDDDFNDI